MVSVFSEQHHCWDYTSCGRECCRATFDDLDGERDAPPAGEGRFVRVTTEHIEAEGEFLHVTYLQFAYRHFLFQGHLILIHLHIIRSHWRAAHHTVSRGLLYDWGRPVIRPQAALTRPLWIFTLILHFKERLLATFQICGGIVAAPPSQIVVREEGSRVPLPVIRLLIPYGTGEIFE